MSVSAERFQGRDVYIDYPQERVMYRWANTSQKLYRCFYGERDEQEVPYTDKMFRDAMSYGNEVRIEVYDACVSRKA